MPRAHLASQRRQRDVPRRRARQRIDRAADGYTLLYTGAEHGGHQPHRCTVPKGTPADVIARLAAESRKIESEDFRARLRVVGVTLRAERRRFAKVIADDFQAWGRVVRDDAIKVE